MFKHQIIGDIQKINAFVKNKNYKILFADYIMPILLKAETFYMGDMKSLQKIFKRFFGMPVFVGEAAIDVNMPYPVCLFEANYSDRSFAILTAKTEVIETDIIKEDDDLVYFIFKKVDKAWIPSAGMGMVAIDKRTEFFFVDKERMDRIENFLSLGVIFLNTCLMLLNTQNIVTNKVIAPKKLNKKRIKKGEIPHTDYYTIGVKNPSEYSKRENRKIENPGITRLHLCRGHFKTYTEENPLFGRIVGRIWWQPHIRGNKDQGLILKDYHVKHA